MPRQARLIVPDIAIHIVQRGHDRADCFRHDSDYLVYLSNLRDLLPRSGCALHAYCLMTNHVHLLLTPSQPDGCALLMRDLGQRYVQYFNRRYQRSGTLWDGRFRSCLVDSGRYMLACYRYVERNPVRAGMVPSPGAYPWSSHAGNVGELANNLLKPHDEYLALSEQASLRYTAYRQLFDTEDQPDFLAAIRDATNGGFALVGDALKSRLSAKAQQRLARRHPGPSAVAAPEQGDILEELGLRPRTS
jgi:putative transposase